MNLRIGCALALVVPMLAMAGGKAHEHGVARLDVAAQPGVVAIHLESPLDNLAGFERAPKNAAERQRLDAVLARLKAADALFRFDAAAQCSVTTVSLASAALRLGAFDPKDAADGHADLDADYEFACKGAAPAYVDTTLLEALPRVQRVEVQAAGSKGQSRATLKRPERRITIRN